MITVSQRKELEAIAGRFQAAGTFEDVRRMEAGHINKTFVVTMREAAGPHRYILQSINTAVFTHPEELMQNIVGVTTFLKKKIEEYGGDVRRETLTVIESVTGESFFVDADGKYWRMYDFIEGATSYETVVRPILFKNTARAFGKFQKLLADYPAHTLFETIPKFHDTTDRMRQLREAVSADRAGRVKDTAAEISFYMEREALCGEIVGRIAAGELPLRVTHNDTKLNNIMIDNETDEGVCIIDLDTVMPGSVLYDFGDSIRFGASSAAEDEKDLERVFVRLDLFETYTQGFLEAAGESLTETEIELLPLSAKLMTMECGMRFLTDYLNGDVYFHTSYEGQNLDRTRTHIKLISDMETKWEEMHQIVQRCRKDLSV